MQKIFETIRKARVQLRSMWRSMDPDNERLVDEHGTFRPFVASSPPPFFFLDNDLLSQSSAKASMP